MIKAGSYRCIFVQLMAERKSYTEESSSFLAPTLTCPDHSLCTSVSYTTVVCI